MVRLGSMWYRASSRARVYRTDQELVVNRAAVARLSSVYAQKEVVGLREARELTRGPREEAFTVEGGKPDGMAVDVEGHLWIAVWGAGQVRRYHPDGEAVAVIEVPAPHTSSVAFVGPGRDLLLITTAQDELTDAQLADWPESGRLFLADPGITGLPTTAWHPVPSPSRPPR